MSKMSSHGPFGHLQHKLCAKEGPGVKLAVWLPTTKSQESAQLRCVQGECDTPLKSSQGELQVFFKPRPDRRFEKKVMTLWSPGSPNWTISGLHLGSPGTKGHSDVGATEEHREYKSGPWWVKWVRVARGLSQHQEWFRRCTNQLISWVLMQDWITK
jgi:hypothetical protein